MEIAPNPGWADVPANSRVWIRLAPGATKRFRRRNKKLSVAKLRRAITLRDAKTKKVLKTMLRVDSDGGGDTVLSLRPMSAFDPERRYRVSMRLEDHWKIDVEFEVSKPSGKKPALHEGQVVVDHRANPWDDQTLRVRYRAPRAEPLAPLYEIYLAAAGRSRPSKPFTVEFAQPEKEAWSVDIIARDKCKARYFPKKEEISVWLRPLNWRGTALRPVLGPFKVDTSAPKK